MTGYAVRVTRRIALGEDDAAKDSRDNGTKLFSASFWSVSFAKSLRRH